MDRSGDTVAAVRVDDERLAAALAGWAASEREQLQQREVRVELDGPHDPVGMDPVYILRLRSSGNEAEALLFRGGALLLATYDAAVEVRESHIDATSLEDITAALTALADTL